MLSTGYNLQVVVDFTHCMGSCILGSSGVCGGSCDRITRAALALH